MIVRRHFPDEEPDVDERPGWRLREIEEELCSGLCPRCGLEHREADCHIQPYLFKAEA